MPINLFGQIISHVYHRSKGIMEQNGVVNNLEGNVGIPFSRKYNQMACNLLRLSSLSLTL